MRQVAAPGAARSRSTLARIDYTDAFLADTSAAQERTGEEWARAVLEGAPPQVRQALTRGWAMLGLRLDPSGPGPRVLGWELRRSDPDFALLGARSRLGFEGEVLFERREASLLVATFGHLKNPFARLLWVMAGPQHRRAVPYLLRQGCPP